MNPFSLYVQISRLVFQFEKTDQNWQQLKKLVPYLRVSLQCVICRELLRTPYKNYCCTNCHYNVCKLCLSKITNIRIPCNWCNENKKYDENVQLRILLQCYKSLCDYIQNNQLFQDLFCSKDNTYPTSPSLSISSTNDLFLPPQPSSLKELIEEGASYGDEFKLSSGQTFTSILPTYTSTGTQTVNVINNNINPNITCNNSNSSTINSVSNNINTSNSGSSISINSTINLNNNNNNNNNNTIINTEKIALMTATTTSSSSSTSNPLPHPPIKTVSNGSNLYSVMYAGSGNKITIKRKTDANNDDDSGCGASGGLSSILNNSDLNSFKKPNTSSFTPVISSNVGTSSAGQKPPSKNLLKRKGCRCGNATPTPGKLTCCGQRCPCYVESKSCIDCKCRGCRNPHRPNGQKVRPHIPELENLEFTLKETKIIEHFNNSNNSTNNNSICLNQRTYRVNNNNQQTTQFFQQPQQQPPQQQQQQLQKQQLHQTIQQQIQQKQNLKNQQQQQMVHQNQVQQSFRKQQNVQQQLLHTNQIHQTLQKHQQLIHTNQVEQPVLKQQPHQHLQLPQQTVTTTAPLILNSNSLSNGTIQVVGVYTTHLPTETALPSILMDDYSSSVIPSSNLLNHSLFNNSNNLSTSCETNTLINKPNIMNYDDSSLDEMNNVEID